MIFTHTLSQDLKNALYPAVSSTTDFIFSLIDDYGLVVIVVLMVAMVFFAATKASKFILMTWAWLIAGFMSLYVLMRVTSFSTQADPPRQEAAPSKPVGPTSHSAGPAQDPVPAESVDFTWLLVIAIIVAAVTAVALMIWLLPKAKRKLDNRRDRKAEERRAQLDQQIADAKLAEELQKIDGTPDDILAQLRAIKVSYSDLLAHTEMPLVKQVVDGLEQLEKRALKAKEQELLELRSSALLPVLDDLERGHTELNELERTRQVAARKRQGYVSRLVKSAVQHSRQ